MIGKIYWSLVSFYDAKSRKNSFKYRPVLIIGDARNNDFTVLPISTISIKTNIDPDFDVKINPTEYPDTKLQDVSYVRTHKQIYLHKSSISRPISDLKAEYPDLYSAILERWEKFHKHLAKNAL